MADVACGTGDMMGLWYERNAKGYNNANLTRLVGIDPSNGMLEVAKEKYPKLSL